MIRLTPLSYSCDLNPDICCSRSPSLSENILSTDLPCDFLLDFPVLQTFRFLNLNLPIPKTRLFLN
jgi:hypothetical protein